MLEAKALGCERGDRRLFSQLNIQAAAGSLLFVEGRNGSGKTTLLRALCGLLTPTEGEICWHGKNIKKLREEFSRELLFLGHLNGVKLDLNPLENLRFNCRLNNENPDDDALLAALETIGLGGFETFPASMLSQGQKRRIALAQLLLSNASLWILDEPFTALDTAAVDQLQQVIRQHLENSGIVVLTTHQAVEITSGDINHLVLGNSNHA